MRTLGAFLFALLVVALCLYAQVPARSLSPQAWHELPESVFQSLSPDVPGWSGKPALTAPSLTRLREGIDPGRETIRPSTPAPSARPTLRPLRTAVEGLRWSTMSEQRGMNGQYIDRAAVLALLVKP
jgi:hypothetical protein